MPDHGVRRASGSLPQRSGFIGLFLSICLVLLLSMIAFAFHNLGMNSVSEVSRARIGETALRLAQSAIDEATDDFQRKVSTPTRAQSSDPDLYDAVRKLAPGKFYTYNYKSPLTTQVADPSAQISPVAVAVSRIVTAPVSAGAAAISGLSPDVLSEVKAAWEVYLQTGVCGPDMDLVLGSTGAASTEAAGFAEFKVQTTLPAASSDIARELEIRRTFSNTVYSDADYASITKALGLTVPSGPSLPVPSPVSGPVSGTTGSGSTPVTTSTGTGAITSSPGSVGTEGVTYNDVHLSPYDDLRIVRRTEDKSW